MPRRASSRSDSSYSDGAPRRFHLGEQIRSVRVRLQHRRFLLPSMNSMQRYCQLWKPLLLLR